MRKILTVVCVLSVMFSVFGFTPKHLAAQNDFGIFKEWQTDPEDGISFNPTVSKDGAVYGITMSDYWSETESKLTCVKDGKIAWQSDETFNNRIGLSSVKIVGDNVYALEQRELEDEDSGEIEDGEGEGREDGEEESEDTINYSLVSYTLDGERNWIQNIELYDYGFPGWTVKNDKIYVIMDTSYYIFNAKTGRKSKDSEIPTGFSSKTHSLNQPKPNLTAQTEQYKSVHSSAKTGNEPGYGAKYLNNIIDEQKNKNGRYSDISKLFTPFKSPLSEAIPNGTNAKNRLDLSYLNFVGDKMIFIDSNDIYCYKLDEKDNLTTLWTKGLANDEVISIANLLLVMNANSNTLLYINSKGALQKLDIETGKVLWEVKRSRADRNSEFYYANYNDKVAILSSESGFRCFSMKDGKKLWENEDDYAVFPAHITEDNIFFTFGDLVVADVKTGNVMKNATEDAFIAFSAIQGEAIYVQDLEARSIAKYTFCKPCQCEFEAFWEKTNNDALSIEVCPLSETKANIVLKNNNDKHSVFFSLSSNSDFLTFAESELAVPPKQIKVVEATYSLSMEMEEENEFDVEIKTNCSDTLTLKLSVEKGKSCKEPLKKIWETVPGIFHIIKDNNLIKIDDNYEEGEYTLTAIDMTTGKQSWSFEVFKEADDMEEVTNIINVGKNLLIRAVGYEESFLWCLVDYQTGKLVWKRTTGEPWGLVVNKEYYEDTDVEFFDTLTGKVVCGPVKIAEGSAIKTLYKRGDSYYIRIFNYVEEDVWTYAFDSKGKTLWKSEYYFRSWGDDQKGLYVTDILATDDLYSKEDETNKLSRVDPKTGKTIWTVDTDGVPYVVFEYKNFAYVIDNYNVNCFDYEKGSKKWSKKFDDMIGWVDMYEDKLFFGQETDTEAEAFTMLDAATGNVILTDAAESTESYYFIENGKLFLLCRYTISEDEDEYYYAQIICFDLKGKSTLLWEVKNKGRFFIDENKVSFIYYEGKSWHLSWYIDGKQSGKTDVEIKSDDEYGFYGDFDVGWIENNIYLSIVPELRSFDSKTSKLNWKLFDTDYGVKIFDKSDNKHITPCAAENFIFSVQNKKLTCYKPQ